jgi:hypothetical protein
LPIVKIENGTLINKLSLKNEKYLQYHIEEYRKKIEETNKYKSIDEFRKINKFSPSKILLPQDGRLLSKEVSDFILSFKRTPNIFIIITFQKYF